jgi:tetratricopeptide (TPR) repeat protein
MGLAVDQPINVTYGNSVREFHKKLFDLLSKQGKSETANRVPYELLAPFEKAVADSPEDDNLRIRLADAYMWMPCMLTDTGRGSEVKVLMDRALELYSSLPEDVAGSNYRGNTARRYANKGALLASRNRLQEAEVAYRKAIRIHTNSWFQAAHYERLGDVLRAQPDRITDAALAYQESLNRYREMHYQSPTEPLFAQGIESSYDKLFSLLDRAGNSTRSEQLLSELTVLYDKLLANDSKNAHLHNSFAWALATSSVVEVRDPQRAVSLAMKATELASGNGDFWNTVGVAEYRAGNWQAAMEALMKSMDLNDGGAAVDWFFLAMSHWQLGYEDEAREWYTKAVEWMETNATDNEELIRFRTEAAELLGVNEKKESEPSSTSAQ